MNEIAKGITEYGLLVVIAGIFIWDWVVNKKQNTEILKELKDSNKNIAISSENIAKSLDIVLNNQTSEERKLDSIENKIARISEDIRR